MHRTQIIGRVLFDDWLSFIDGREIRLHEHVFDHLIRAERSLYDEGVLIRVVMEEKPRLIGWQRNGRFALYYRRSYGFLKLIVYANESVTILTFMKVETMPDVRALPRWVLR